MRRDTQAWLQDIYDAATLILALARTHTLDSYTADRIASSAVERQFIIIGEALVRLARNDPETAAQIADQSDIIAFRNIIVHGYDIVEHKTVWGIIQDDLPRLLAQTETLMSAGGE